MNVVVIAKWWVRGLITLDESKRFLDDLGYTGEEIARVVNGWYRSLCYWFND